MVVAWLWHGYNMVITWLWHGYDMIVTWLWRRNYNVWPHCNGLLRGGGGVHPNYFVKVDFEIAIDQQTRARDRTFEGVPDSGWPPVPAGQPRPYWSICGPILPNDLNMIKTMIWGALLVATSLLSTCILYCIIFGHTHSEIKKRKLWKLAANFFEGLNQKSASHNKGFFSILKRFWNFPRKDIEKWLSYNKFVGIGYANFVNWDMGNLVHFFAIIWQQNPTVK